MKNNFVELIFILDRSGSMRGLEADTVGGFNSMIEKQKQLEGNVKVSTVIFNQRSTVLHDRQDINEIGELKVEDFNVSGTTALLDAVGRSIRHIKRIYADTLCEHRPKKVIFMITTDGMENASREFSYKNVKRSIDRVTEEYNWEILFMAANIDSVSEASKMGIKEDRAVRYRADSRGTRTNFNAMNSTMSELRLNRELNKNWKKDIEDDYKKNSNN